MVAGFVGFPHVDMYAVVGSIPCPQKEGKFYPILLHKFNTHRTGKNYLLFPDGLYLIFTS